MGLEVEEAKGGCCGLAGSWGFEEGKYDISRQCGEVGFLPAVRKADPETYIVADGFSCKTQLEQSGIGRQGAAHRGGHEDRAGTSSARSAARALQVSPAGAARLHSRREDCRRHWTGRRGLRLNAKSREGSAQTADRAVGNAPAASSGRDVVRSGAPSAVAGPVAGPVAVAFRDSSRAPTRRSCGLQMVQRRPGICRTCRW